jgi:hypothetical protein
VWSHPLVWEEGVRGGPKFLPLAWPGSKVVCVGVSGGKGEGGFRHKKS